MLVTMRDAFDALSVAERDRLQLLVQTVGERGACDALGTPRSTLARALAGLRLRRGTVAFLRVRLNRQEVHHASR
jgi:hypothetical protein